MGVLAPEDVWVRPAAQGGEAQVAAETNEVAVVNTSDPDGPRVTFTHEEWKDFLIGVKNGEFDIK